MEQNCAAWLFDRITAGEDVTAIFDGDAIISRSQLWQSCLHAATVLRYFGCVPGDRVLIALPEGIDFAIVFFGAVYAGIVPVVIDAASSEEEVIQTIADTQPKRWVSNSKSAAYCALPAAKCLVFVDSEWGCQLDPGLPPPPAVKGQNTPAFILYTSGSTGIRKGVLHSHRAVIAACDSIATKVFGFAPSDRVLSTARLAFAFGLGFGLYLPLSAGAATVLGVDRRRLDVLASAILRFQPTVLCAVPSLLASLLRASESWLSLNLTSLRFIVSAGEPLPARLFDIFRERYEIEVLDGLGTTELLTHIITNQPGDARGKSCGLPAPGVEVRLVDEKAEDVADGVPGVLLARSPSACLGYVNRPDAKSPIGPGGWCETGDILYRDTDGHYVYCGRSEDTLKVNGEWVLPEEVAEHLRKCLDIANVFVTTQKDRSEIRRLVAYVVPRDGAMLRPMQVIKHCRDLPLRFIPSAVVLVRELPLLANGKVNRQALPRPDWGPPASGRL